MILSSRFRAFALASCWLLLCPMGVVSTLVETMPTDDAMVRGGGFESTNFGTYSGSLMVKQKKSSVSREDLNRRSFLKFDINGIQGTIATASVRLFVMGAQSASKVSICPVTEEWSESTITWLNQPSYGSSLGDKDIPPEGQYVEWDVAAHLQQLINNGETVLSLALDGSPVIDQYSTFYSKESSNEAQRPKLFVDYDDVVATATTDEPVVATTEPLVTTTVEPTDTTVRVPYDLPKFQPALNAARLQYPESSPTAVNAGQFAGYSSDGFQLVDDQYIQFHISSSEGARSELRHDTEFASSDAIERSIQARMKIPQPDGSLVTQFTFLQVHTKDFLGNPSGPLLRIVWFNSRNGNRDWLWANIRKSLNPKSNEYFPLQARPNDFFDIEVRVVNSTLSILIDGSYPNPVYNAYNLSYWDPIQTNYFKAGAYLNSGSTGPVVTLFDELTFTV